MAGRRYRIVFRPDAESDLKELFDYIALHAGAAVAEGYIERILSRIASLDLFPQQGTRRDDIKKGIRTIGFERRATIAFRVVGREVEIVSVAYGGRQFEDRLRKIED